MAPCLSVRILPAHTLVCGCEQRDRPKGRSLKDADSRSVKAAHSIVSQGAHDRLGNANMFSFRRQVSLNWNHIPTHFALLSSRLRLVYPRPASNSDRSRVKQTAQPQELWKWRSQIWRRVPQCYEQHDRAESQHRGKQRRVWAWDIVRSKGSAAHGTRLTVVVCEPMCEALPMPCVLAFARGIRIRASAPAADTFHPCHLSHSIDGKGRRLSHCLWLRHAEEHHIVSNKGLHWPQARQNPNMRRFIFDSSIHDRFL